MGNIDRNKHYVVYGQSLSKRPPLRVSTINTTFNCGLRSASRLTKRTENYVYARETEAERDEYDNWKRELNMDDYDCDKYIYPQYLWFLIPGCIFCTRIELL